MIEQRLTGLGFRHGNTTSELLAVALPIVVAPHANPAFPL
jgi:hypothetical protein